MARARQPNVQSGGLAAKRRVDERARPVVHTKSAKKSGVGHINDFGKGTNWTPLPVSAVSRFTSVALCCL